MVDIWPYFPWTFEIIHLAEYFYKFLYKEQNINKKIQLKLMKSKDRYESKNLKTKDWR